MKISTLRPGLLVSLKTSLQGNVSYKTRDIEVEHLEEDGTLRARWETARMVQDPGEHEAGVKARSRARALVTAVCSDSTFGLLCPEASRSDLTDAIEAARDIAAAFNATAQITRLNVNVIVGRVASDDADATRAINSEVRDLMDAMTRGLQDLNVAAVREAANKAKQLSQMLSPEGSRRAQAAIEAARSAARAIVKAGESVAIEIDETVIRTIRESRLAFLDIEDEDTDVDIEAPIVTARGIDLEPEAEGEPEGEPGMAGRACAVFPSQLEF
jgi:hypothetical protein